MSARQPGPEANAAIRATVLDYFEGWYDADRTRMARALHPDLAKRAWPQDATPMGPIGTLGADRMIALTAAGEGIADGAADRRVQIEIADASDDIASVVVHTPVYDEYLHLVATPDGWRIVNALWRYADGHHPAS